jgi:MinD superfamily P-loop ATPase
MKSITVISGKGGTGKTILTASFAALAKSKVMADCDLDAADLHLILEPDVKREEIFEGGKAARIDPDKCLQCGQCMDVCRYEAISDSRVAECEDQAFRKSLNKKEKEGFEGFVVDPIKCEGCAFCCNICPAEAIEMEPSRQGRWYISETRHGPMVHTKLGIAEENSGKLVALVRQQAKLIAEKEDLKDIIVDDPTGIGCPVIFSITGTDLVLVVTEPTISGLHDLQRVVGLANHFGVKSLVCVNKYDLNVQFTDQIEAYCKNAGAAFLGRIPFDTVVTEAMVNGKSVVEYDEDSQMSREIKRIWDQVDEIADSI